MSLRTSNHLTFKRTRRIVVCAALALALPLAAGCGSTSNSSSTDNAAQTKASASVDASSSSSESEASLTNLAAQAAAETSSANEDATTEDGTTSSGADESDASETTTFSLSDDLTEDGRWEGVDAQSLVTLPDYSSITVPASAVDVSDSVESQIQAITSQFATQTQVTDRAVQDGDTVNIDYTGRIDGVAFDGGSTHGTGTTVTIGTTNYIDGFLDQLVGHTPGETFDVVVTFPDDYGVDDLNGKTATFETTINYIVETTQPDLTDDFVSQNLSSTYGWNTVDEMRSSIQSDLYQDALESYVIDTVVNGSTVADVLPPSMVSYQQNALISYYQSYADAYGMSLDDFLSQAVGVSSTDDLIAQNQDNINSTVRRYLVYQAIADAEGLSVTDDDARAYYEEASSRAARSAGVSSAMDFSQAEETYGMPYLKLCALQDKVIDLLVSRASVSES